jgi:hypothetical protein
MENGRGRLVGQAMAAGRYGFMGFGAIAFLLFTLGLVADYRNFDRTSGGYEAPYTGYQGEPIDWSQAYITSEGMVRTGYVLNTYVDCSSGMVSFEIYGQRFNWRELSPRALAAHQPAAACAERGFDPQF